MKKSTTTPDTNLTETNTMKKVTLSTAILSNVITFLATVVFVTITTWFVYSNIHQEARADVVRDIQTVQTVSKD